MSVVQQDILSGSVYPRTLTIRRVTATEAARQLSKRLSKSGTADIVPVGISYRLSRDGNADLMCLAQSTEADVLLVPFSKKSTFDSISNVLCVDEATDCPSSPKIRLVGFGMAQIAIQISTATDLRVKGVDILTLCSNPGNPSTPWELIVNKVDNEAKGFVVQRLWMGNKASATNDAVLQAWLAACAGDKCKTGVTNAASLDTSHLAPSVLDILSQLVAQSELLEKLKPREVRNDFSEAGLNASGQFQIHNFRFKSKVRRSNQTVVIMRDRNNHRFEGAAIKSQGKRTTIKLKGKAPSGNLRSIKVVGLPELTNSEKARDELVHLVVAGKKSLEKSPFIQKLWFPRINHTKTTTSASPDTVISLMRLNDSQRVAMCAMVGESPIVIVHGPPGTGKTTTITAAAQIWDSRKFYVWILAHSNVAVKNIAEKLLANKVDFKILISKEFYEEWHEHLYSGEMEEKLIRSDRLEKNKVGMSRLILNSKVILSTLGMMLNPKLRDNGTFDIVPPRCLVIDEASQINGFEFMPIFDTFQKHIKKVCFFGDPLQLPPFGQADVPKMQTIFDFKHLNKKEDTYFLNTQYRMPNPIARFISKKVYKGRLLSEHNIDNPDCLAFIDVPRTGETAKGAIIKNSGEVDTVVHLVKLYYRKLNFCIITPYDAQRAAIENALKAEKLPWETVYNVDSFQGNEADYVIVSLVRSSRPGFLDSVQRMNVLLTRCKRGLTIISSQAFLGPGGKGADTLLGELVQLHWKKLYSNKWIDWRFVADGSADLPGVTRSSPTSHRTVPTGNATQKNSRRPNVAASPLQKRPQQTKGNKRNQETQA